MDREAWQATVHGVAKSRTQLSDSDTHTHTHTHTTGGLLRSGDYQANGGRHGEEKMFVAALPAPKKTWKASQKCVKDMLCHLPWNLTAVLFLSPYNL